MPTYNVAPWVSEAIQSVLGQTYNDFELLVMDDCSTDDTVSIVRSIEDSRIRIIQNEKNVGLAENLNIGLSHITTEYVARMDGDDIAESYWLEHEVNILNNHPEIGICSGGFERFGTRKSLVRFPEKHEDILANMLFECTVIVPTFRMSLYHEHGLRYRTDAFPAEDYRFWAECMRITKVYNIQETLFQYRMHPSQICSERKVEQEKKVAEVRQYMLDWLNPDFTEEDKQYYTEIFVGNNIESRQDLKQRKSFAHKMISLNRSVRHFDETALRKRLDKHLTLAVYNTVVEKYFAKGYIIGKYLCYLCDGLAFRTNLRYEMKFLLKSILQKKI